MATLSVIIPNFNESQTIELLIAKVLLVNIDIQVIIVDDASTDGSVEILKKYEDRPNFKIVYHQSNKGKGAAIRSGIKYVEGKIVIIQDADLEYEPNDYQHLIEPILMQKTKVVYGSRLLSQKNNKSYLSFYWGGRLVTFFTNLLYNQALTDEPTCYKVFDANLLRSINLECKRFEFCPEVTAKIAKLGIRIPELPIAYYPRKMEDGKKIKWYDGIEALWVLLKYKFVD